MSEADEYYPKYLNYLKIVYVMRLFRIVFGCESSSLMLLSP